MSPITVREWVAAKSGHCRVRVVSTDRSPDWVAISPFVLDTHELVAWATRPDCGAVVTFVGTARTTSTTGHEILELEYETDPRLAERRLAEVTAEARARWPEIRAVVLHHRIGTVHLTEPAVVVVVASPHRGEAFDAARFCIDAVKRTVPMWKREVWRGGSAWSDEAIDIVDVVDVNPRATEEHA